MAEAFTADAVPVESERAVPAPVQRDGDKKEAPAAPVEKDAVVQDPASNPPGTFKEAEAKVAEAGKAGEDKEGPPVSQEKQGPLVHKVEADTSVPKPPSESAGMTAPSHGEGDKHDVPPPSAGNNQDVHVPVSADKEAEAKAAEAREAEEEKARKEAELNKAAEAREAEEEKARKEAELNKAAEAREAEEEKARKEAELNKAAEAREAEEEKARKEAELNKAAEAREAEEEKARKEAELNKAAEAREAEEEKARKEVERVKAAEARDADKELAKKEVQEKKVAEDMETNEDKANKDADGKKAANAWEANEEKARKEVQEKKAAEAVEAHEDKAKEDASAPLVAVPASVTRTKYDVMSMIAELLRDPSKKRMMEDELDPGKSGQVTLSDFHKAVSKLGRDISSAETKEVFGILDVLEEGSLPLREVLVAFEGSAAQKPHPKGGLEEVTGAATNVRDKYALLGLIGEVFRDVKYRAQLENDLDPDRSGLVTLAMFQQAASNMGKNIRMEEAKQVFDLVDVLGEGSLSIREIFAAFNAQLTTPAPEQPDPITSAARQENTKEGQAEAAPNSSVTQLEAPKEQRQASDGVKKDEPRSAQGVIEDDVASRSLQDTQPVASTSVEPVAQTSDLQRLPSLTSTRFTATRRPTGKLISAVTQALKHKGLTVIAELKSADPHVQGDALSLAEFHQALVKIDTGLSADEIKSLFHSLCQQGCTTLHYSTLVATLVDVHAVTAADVAGLLRDGSRNAKVFGAQLAYDLLGGSGRHSKKRQAEFGERSLDLVQMLLGMLQERMWLRGCLYAVLALAELVFDNEPISRVVVDTEDALESLSHLMRSDAVVDGFQLSRAAARVLCNCASARAARQPSKHDGHQNKHKKGASEKDVSTQSKEKEGEQQSSRKVKRLPLTPHTKGRQDKIGDLSKHLESYSAAQILHHDEAALKYALEVLSGPVHAPKKALASASTPFYSELSERGPGNNSAQRDALSRSTPGARLRAVPKSPGIGHPSPDLLHSRRHDLESNPGQDPLHRPRPASASMSHSRSLAASVSGSASAKAGGSRFPFCLEDDGFNPFQAPGQRGLVVKRARWSQPDASNLFRARQHSPKRARSPQRAVGEDARAREVLRSPGARASPLRASRGGMHGEVRGELARWMSCDRGADYGHAERPFSASGVESVLRRGRMTVPATRHVCQQCKDRVRTVQSQDKHQHLKRETSTEVERYRTLFKGLS